ncbi:MAG TPA: TetR/AcrR family transcriptional regulator C-terminal domain-containing protein [Chthonomonadales bacterium]|nr:TetR/AcrR family transcriptional regulator C-terminal domain-containing protein [Chthonomonadales bacterium]
MARIVLDPLPGLLARPAGDPEAALRLLVEDRLAIWERHAPLMKALFAEALFRPELAEAVRRRAFEPALAELTAFLERGVAEGRLRSMDPRAAALALVALVLGIAIQREVARMSGGTPIEADPVALAALIVHGIAAPHEAR